MSLRLFQKLREVSIQCSSRCARKCLPRGHIRMASSAPNSTSFPSFNTAESFAKFVKCPNYVIVSSVIIKGVPNVPFEKRKLAKFEQLQDLTPESFTDGATVAVDSVTSNLYKCLQSDQRDEAIHDLEWQLTPQCLQRVSSIFASPDIDENVPNVIAIAKEDIFFSWISTSSSISSGELRILFCTLSIKGYNQMVAKLENQQKEIEQFFAEMKTMKESGTDPKSMADLMNGFRSKLVTPKSLIESEPMVISNFDFVIRENQDWMIDQVSMKSVKDVWSSYGAFRWKMRLLISLNKRTSFLNVLRYDYMTDWIICLIFFNILLFKITSS